MKAIRYEHYGDADVLRYQEVERPLAGSGQVLVRVAATSFNPVDAAIRAGYLQQAFALRLPHTPGLDVAGMVAALGDGVEGLGVGDGVVGFLPMTENGAAAEYVVAPASALAPAPTAIALQQAAALPVAGLTAWQALFEHAGLEPGQRVLINGAGGAVGGYAVQLAVQSGADVVAVAGRRSADQARRYGAAEVLDYAAGPVSATTRQPVDVVLNLAATSAPEMAGLLALVRPAGVLVTTVPPGPDPAGRDIRVLNLFLHSDTDQLSALVARVDAGQLQVVVEHYHPLADLKDVHSRSDAGDLHGKFVLVPSA